MSTLRRMTNDDLLAYKRLCTICYNYARVCRSLWMRLRCMCAWAFLMMMAACSAP